MIVTDEDHPFDPGQLEELTDLGLRYGINKPQQLIDETTPRYFEDTFEELVSKYLMDG